MTHENYRQKSLFEPELHQSDLNLEYIERDPERSECADDQPGPLVGPHMSLNQYYETTLEMIQEVCGANRGRYFVAKNTTTEGFSRTVEQYGGVSEALSVSMNTGRRAFRLQNRMDKLFQVDELILAGFAATAIYAASKKNTAELTALYTGTHNENARARKRRDINSKLKALNQSLSTDN